MITSAIKSIAGLQALKNGNLLMTVKRDVYFRAPEWASRWVDPDEDMSDRAKLNLHLTEGWSDDCDSRAKSVIEACSVENMSRTFECNVKYDDFFSTIRDVLKRVEWRGMLPEDFDHMTNADLWMASAGYIDESEEAFFIVNQTMNQLLINAVPEEHYDMFLSVMPEWDL